MEQVTPLFPRPEPMFAPLDPAAEQERVRLGLQGLRDLLEGIPSIITIDPHAIGALVGLCADALPVFPESEED